MGVESRRPPLPAPTDISSADNESHLPDDLATDVSRVTEKTSYSIPEDGSPVTITTKNKRTTADLAAQSQTSLLIEYFEGGKSSDKPHSRPSVRVRVTPSSRRTKSSRANDHIQITETGKNRKPSYTRRISLGTSNHREENLVQPTELSVSSNSNVSGNRAPVEVEVLQNLSDLSRSDLSRDRRMLPTSTDISSMPPDSMLEGEPVILSPERVRRRSRSSEREEVETDLLKAPSRRRSRSLSRERITQKATQKVMEKLKDRPADARTKSRSSTRKVSREEAIIDEMRSPKRKTTKGREDDVFSGTESSMLSSNVHRRSGDSHSIRSGSAISGTSSINNPKLLQTVEDAIRRLILPELNALKEEQKTQKNREKFERVTRDSMASASSREDLRKRLSKTSSAPDVKKPKVTLSRHGEDKEVILSGDSVKSRSSRRSSRESVDGLREEERSHRRSSGEKKHRHRTRDVVAAGLVGSALTAAALKHHDSSPSIGKERRKRRSSHSKSRSRTASISESIEDSYRKEDIPPLPMRSEMNASELTRDSILTAESEREHRRDSVSSRGIESPIREVARSSPREVHSPMLNTPPRTPSALRQGLYTHHSNRSVGDVSLSNTKNEKSVHTKTSAAPASPLFDDHFNDRHDQILEQTQRKVYSPGRPLSPIQSVASYKDDLDDIHHRPASARSARSTQSAAREAHPSPSDISIGSLASSPSTKIARTRKRPIGVNLERREEILGQHGTPDKREIDDFFEKSHEENERYRRELRHDASPGGSFKEKHMSNFTEESNESPLPAAQDIRGVGGRAEYVVTPVAVESAVASLHEPSNLSVRSSTGSPVKRINYSDISSTSDPARNAQVQAAIEQSRMMDLSPNKERWRQIKEQAQQRRLHEEPRTVSEKLQHDRAAFGSPHRGLRSATPVKMGASAIPMVDDPMPEIGYHGDDLSEVTTNPSEIKGPLGGYDYGDKSHWPADPTPAIDAGLSNASSPSHDHFAGKTAAFAGGATAAAIAAAAANRIRMGQDDDSLRSRQTPLLEQEYDDSPRDAYSKPLEYGRPESVPESPGAYNPDEGYISTAQPGDITPDPYRTDRYNAGHDIGPNTFAPPSSKHVRHISGMSHGMESPLYDSSTGRGMDAINSKDIVALMDHLAVRDAQRNARDTEILVTLVRSAAEMRNQFEEMKKFIADQDNAIMTNTTQQSNILGQKILQGPRPQPLGSPRVPRTAHSSTDGGTEDIQVKRRNIFKRALKGLGQKSTNDLANIEGMLMQLLDEVEGLREGQDLQRSLQMPANKANSLTSYENLRMSGDPGYDPEGQAGTSSTPNHSGYLSNPSSSKPNRINSGYQAHRISTVEEDDEEYAERETKKAGEAYEDERGFSTPTQEARRAQTMPNQTPPQPSGQLRNSLEEDTPKRKHKSNNSSIFGIPKISRWSKTTASTPPDPNRKSRDRPYSEASRSGSQVNVMYDDDYHIQDDDRIRSMQSLVDEGGVASNQQRSPSPLIPEEDDPKYQAHRNSLNLQHPQPRPGPTQRHQNHLESQARSFVPVSGTPELFFMDNKSDLDNKHDQWGSNPSLILNRGQPHTQTLSPVASDRPFSSGSTGQQTLARSQTSNEHTVVPPKVSINDKDSPYADVPGAGYVSPHSYSSGHLAPLAPIEEVRYSLETDGGRQVRAVWFILLATCYRLTSFSRTILHPRSRCQWQTFSAS